LNCPSEGELAASILIPRCFEEFATPYEAGGLPEDDILDEVDDLDLEGKDNLTLHHLRAISCRRRSIGGGFDRVSTDPSSHNGIRKLFSCGPKAKGTREFSK
jgi:hypothetical protein